MVPSLLRLPGQRRIIRLHLADQQSLGHALRHSDALWCGHLRYGDRGRADNATDDTTHLSTGDAAGNAAHYTS